MASAPTSQPARARGVFHRLGAAVRLALRQTFALEDAGSRAEKVRAITLAGLVAAAFLVLGSMRQIGVLAHSLAESPFDFDLALRTVALGWFDSNRNVPITIVEIDAQTHRAWGQPALTPRADLTRILRTVTAAGPSAIVVDIDLSGSVPEGDSETSVLREYLAGYSGPAPLIFPKRIETTQRGVALATVSPFDPVFERNSHLVWAHAGFSTDRNGKVRDWQEWMALCGPSGPAWLPSVPVAVVANVESTPAGLARPVPPAATADACTDPFGAVAGVATRRLFVGPRLTGTGQIRLQADANVISAALLLDPEVARDDHRLFAERIVLIGATHDGAGDNWLTAGGVRPGVELLADSLRFWPLQQHANGAFATAIERVTAVLLFWLLAWLAWKYRGLIALLLASLLGVAVVALGVGVFAQYRTFDMIESAIALVIVYKAFDTVLQVFASFRQQRPRFTRGIGGSIRTLHRALQRSPDAPTGED
jgi:CHASE2 domain-containing sensor protein